MVAAWFLLKESPTTKRDSDFADAIWKLIQPLPRRVDFIGTILITLLAYYYFDRFLRGLQLLSPAFCIWILIEMVALHQIDGPRWQLYLPAGLLCCLQVVPTFRSTCFYEYQTKTLDYSNVQIGWLSLADIQFFGKIKSALFGGEELFFATLRGPGKIWLQSLPLSRMANRIVAASKTGGRREEGSVLGGLGNLLDGDN